MNERTFITKLRMLRNHLQERLHKCENQDLRDKITRKLEMYNIMLEEFGYPAYNPKRKRPNAF